MLTGDGHGSLINLRTGQTTGQYFAAAGPAVFGFVTPVAFSPDGNLFAAASERGSATLWETSSLCEVTTFRGVLAGMESVVFSTDGERLVTASNGKEAIKLWDLASHQELLTLEGQG